MPYRTLTVAALISAAAAASLPVHQSGFVPNPAGWTTWSARPETAPRTYVDPTTYRTRPGALAISGNSNAAEHGGWEYRIANIEPGKSYRFQAYYRSTGVLAQNWQIVARLDWRRVKGTRSAEPEYVYRAVREGAWTKVSLETQAPPETATVVLQL